MLDYHSASIQKLITARDWDKIDKLYRISEIYLFVQDEVLFSYNIDDSIPASHVLADGYGQMQYQRDAVYGTFTRGGSALLDSQLYH